MTTERREDYHNLEGIREDISEIKDDLKKLSLSLHGNDGPGIKTRLDRVEQSMKIISTVVWLAISLLSAAVVSRLLGAW